MPGTVGAEFEDYIEKKMGQEKVAASAESEKRTASRVCCIQGLNGASKAEW